MLMIQLLGTRIIPPPLLVTSHSQMLIIIETLKKLSADDQSDAKLRIYYLQMKLMTICQ